jgi:hypothetical protein
MNSFLQSRKIQPLRVQKLYRNGASESGEPSGDMEKSHSEGGINALFKRLHLKNARYGPMLPFAKIRIKKFVSG